MTDWIKLTGAYRDFAWRRHSVHWDANAAKTRFAAYLLWRMLDHPLREELAKELGHYTDDPAIAEAFQREAALALELVLKARIAKRMRERGADPETEGLPHTHDLRELWRQASLPALEFEDEYRLLLGKSLLIWSGRYPTPRDAETLEKEYQEFEMIGPPSRPDEITIRNPITLDWENFDRLYTIARTGTLP